MFSLDYRDSRPIYQQIVDGLRKLIVSGAFQPGDALPSVRNLAKDLAINPNTIARAYRELEAEGCINTVPGKGAFCAQRENAAAARKKDLLAQLDPLRRELQALGMSGEEWSMLWKEEQAHAESQLCNEAL